MARTTSKSKHASCVDSAKAKQGPRIRLKFIKSPKVPVFSKNVYGQLWRVSCIQNRRATLPSYVFSHTEAQSRRLFRIPIDMDSPELLMMAGFEKHVADEIFALRTQDTTIIDTVRTWIEGKQKTQAFGYPSAPGHETRCAQRADHQWRAALTDLGVHCFMIRDMLDPKYDAVRLARCSCYWVLDNVKQCVAFCQTVSQRIEDKQADDFVERMHALSGQHHQDALSLAKWNERTVFYKAGSVALLQQCFNRDGTTDLKPLLESNDLHSDQACAHLHSDPDSAILEAEYINHRIQQVDTAVLNIAVPNWILSTLTEDGRIDDDDDDDAITALSERPKLFRRVPTRLQETAQSKAHLQKVSLVVRPVRIDNKHGFERSTCRDEKQSREAIRKGGSCPVQMAVMNQEAMECVERGGRGYVWCSNISEETAWGVKMV